jgi:serine/threonine protein phosphatase PrpC
MNKLGQENISNEAKEKAKNDALDLQLKSKNITLPNGKVGQVYTVPFDVNSLDIPELAEVSFEGLEAIGLEYSPDEKQLKGTPTQPGDYKITLKCKRKDWEEGKPVFERQLTLIINPDPRSLWNNIPTDESIEYFKPDEDKLFVPVAAKSKGPFGIMGKERRKDMVAASQRGRSHAHEGKPRDDDFSLNYDDATNWYTIIVADGAGSAKYSRKGSQIACQTVSDFCKTHLPTLNAEFEKAIKTFHKEKDETSRKLVGDTLYRIIGGAAFKAYKNIEEEATKNNYLLKDFSTTLLVSICKKFDFGWFIGSFWVGDGGIGIYTKEPPFLKIMGEVDSGEFAGQTRFLTMSEIMQPTEIYRRLRFEIVTDFTALVLMTDGITDPKFETDNNLMRIEKWNDLWDDLSKEVDFSDENPNIDQQLLRWLDFWSPGNHDDRTIAILF